MPQKFVNLENLTSFWGNAKEYIDNERQEIEDQLYNWQKTEKAPVVQCEPVPNSELHPTVEFMFKETLPEGEKSPSNPSTINGVNSIGIGNIVNLYSLAKNGSYTNNGVTFTTDEDGILTINGTASAGTGWTRYINNTVLGKIVFPAGTKLHFKMEILGGSYTLPNNTYFKMQFSASYTNGTSWYPGVGIGSKANLEEVFTAQYDFKILSNSLNIPTGMVCNNLKVRCLVEFHDVSNKSWYPQKVNEYTINLGDTYYGGSIDLSTGLMTVTYRYVQANRNTILYNTPVPNSTETFWQFTVKDLRYDDDGYFPAEVYNYQYNQGFKSDNYASNCFNWTGVGVTNRVERSFSISYNYIYITLEGTSAEDARQTLLDIYDTCISNNTPLSFVYLLLTPFTIQLTSQQVKSLPSLEGTSKRINTIYTDVDSVQVEYQKYVGIDSTLDSDSVNAIQNKAVNSALNTKVSLSGDETISGTKTFSNTINGSITGNAGTVAGHIVSKDVPVNAAFTDTTYDPATQSTAGLMSASDKVKLDAVGSVFSFKGSVVNSSSLPASNNANGDAYLAEDTGHVHVYDGTNFVDIGVWAGIPSATDAQIDALFED